MGTDVNRSQPDGAQRAYAPRFVRVPQPDLAETHRTVRRVGMVAGFLGIPAYLATVMLPYFAIPHEVQMRIWLEFAGIVTGASGLGAVGVVSSLRQVVRPGYLDLWLARSARTGLGGTCVVSTVAGATAVALLVRIVTAPVTPDTPAIEFGGFGWGFVAALLVALAVSYTCLFTMRAMLWRSSVVLTYRSHQLPPLHKRR